jgi:predicted RNA binding protein YcfA (HicA-like mRNA interferase family)/predicted RNase H-like HicB family nuclease
VPLKVSEIVKLIEVDGWYLVRTKGSHRQYRHPTKPGTTTVAGKPSDTLHPRTEKSIHEGGRHLMEGAVNGYVVIVERDEAGGYSTWSPDLPGCVAAASDYEECVQLMREAIEFHLEGMRDNGEEIPAPTAIASLIMPAA